MNHFGRIAVATTFALTSVFGSAAMAGVPQDSDLTVPPAGMEQAVEAKGASCNASCQQAVRALVRAWNKYTDPEKCNAPSFRGARSLEDCKSNQLTWRYVGYGVGAAAGVAGAVAKFYRDDDDGPSFG